MIICLYESDLHSLYKTLREENDVADYGKFKSFYDFKEAVKKEEVTYCGSTIVLHNTVSKPDGEHPW